MNPFKGRHFECHIILWAVRWYWRQPSGFGSWHLDETYVKVNGRWAYCTTPSIAGAAPLTFTCLHVVTPKPPIALWVNF